ncbi:MAG: hypothetical protein ABI867_17720 [Kofleriaceae bacterium]
MTAYLLSKLHRRRIAFMVTGAIATGLSITMFALALAAGASPYLATVLRLAIALPVLYAGYSRYMLVEALHADRATIGRLHAELRMLLRVGVAIATSVLLKLAIEPVLATWLLAHWGHAGATLAPLAGDLFYGPLATYVVLNSAAPRSANRERAEVERAVGC